MIKLYADGAAMDGIIEAAKDPMISGFTTNPTLMRQAGVTDYARFAQDVISYLAKNRPETSLSLEVFADEPAEMIRQARQIDQWAVDAGYRVYVKIPVMHTDGTPTEEVIKVLNNEGVLLNITAVFDHIQIINTLLLLDEKTPAIISVFAGRVADMGHDAKEIIRSGLYYRNTSNKHNVEFLWASSREAYNYLDAEESGCDIITMTPELIKKVNKFYTKSLRDFSKETCQMFYDDAIKSGFKL